MGWWAGPGVGLGLLRRSLRRIVFGLSYRLIGWYPNFNSPIVTSPYPLPCLQSHVLSLFISCSSRLNIKSSYKLKVLCFSYLRIKLLLIYIFYF